MRAVVLGIVGLKVFLVLICLPAYGQQPAKPSADELPALPRGLWQIEWTEGGKKTTSVACTDPSTYLKAMHEASQCSIGSVRRVQGRYQFESVCSLTSDKGGTLEAKSVSELAVRSRR
jgi:hypothetical protein